MMVGEFGKEFLHTDAYNNSQNGLRQSSLRANYDLLGYKEMHDCLYKWLLLLIE